MSNAFKKPWKDFKHVATRRFDPGTRHLLPVVGSGFNVAATQGRERDSWFALLRTIREEFGLPQHRSFSARLAGHSMTALWEWFVSTIANKEQQPAYEAENALRRKVQEQLKRFEERNRDQPFYRDFLACGFTDVLSLNFDRTLALSAGGGSRVIQTAQADVVWDASLFRHATVEEAVRTRVWYPHGDTQAYKMIKLGIRDYGVYISSLHQAFASYKQRERAFWDKHPDQAWSRAAYLDWSLKVRQHEAVNWLSLLISAPVIFLGCGMTRDEWPLWWALHQRARNQARLPQHDRDPVFVLWNVTVSDPNHNAMTEWLRTAPADVRLLPCYDWQQGWEDFFAVFEA